MVEEKNLMRSTVIHNLKFKIFYINFVIVQNNKSYGIMKLGNIAQFIEYLQLVLLTEMKITSIDKNQFFDKIKFL